MPRAERSADRDRREHGDPRRLVEVDLELRGDDACHGHARADRQIDAADQDHERHADADDRDLGDLRGEVREIARGHERLARLGVDGEHRPHREQDEDGAQRARRGDLAEAHFLGGSGQRLPRASSSCCLVAHVARAGCDGHDHLLRCGPSVELGNHLAVPEDEDAMREA